jgi:Putative inner membrane protein (DUF1819)
VNVASAHEVAPFSIAPSSRYTIAICKGSALLSETKALLRTWRPGEPVNSFADRVLHENVLGKATAYRVKDIVRRVFARRFLSPNSAAAEHLKTFIRRDQLGQLFSDVCLLYAARHDDLLRDITVDLYWPAVTEGRLELSVKDVGEFLRQAESDGFLSKHSEPVKLKVARGLLKALADFGFLRQVVRGRRETVLYRPTDGVIVYLAYDLHLSGSSDSALVHHRDWQLFGMRERDVIVAMDRLTAEGWWLLQAAGSVVRITWKFPSMQEVVDALAG